MEGSRPLCFGLMPIAHNRLRIGGTLFFSPANWSIGINFMSATGGDPDANAGDVQTQLEEWRDGIKALNSSNVAPENLLSLLSSSGSITTIRCSHVAANGKEDAVALVELGNPVHGTGAPRQLAQAAVACTLETGRPGASYRGRVYWPALGAALNTGGELDAAAAGYYASDMASWVKALGGAGSNLGNPQLIANVVSTVKSSAREITSVRVGSRLDIQRRRARKQDETYSVAVVPQ